MKQKHFKMRLKKRETMKSFSLPMIKKPRDARDHFDSVIRNYPKFILFSGPTLFPPHRLFTHRAERSVFIENSIFDEKDFPSVS